jgi:hypothetical protein
MTTPPDAFTVASRLLGDRELSATQVAQLRAINRKYYQRMFDMLDRPADAERPTSESTTTTESSGRRALTADEADELHAMLESDVREVFGLRG